MPEPQFTERIEDLIAAAARAGFRKVSRTQLARWHLFGLIPQPRQRALGRGKGTETLYPPGTSAQVVAVCALLRRHRQFDFVREELWWNRYQVKMPYIRNRLEMAGDTLLIAAFRARRGSATDLSRRVQRALQPKRLQRLLAELSDDEICEARDQLRQKAHELGLDHPGVLEPGIIQINEIQRSQFDSLDLDAKMYLLAAWIGLREISEFLDWLETTMSLFGVLPDLRWRE